jgi:hypothetical protein
MTCTHRYTYACFQKKPLGSVPSGNGVNVESSAANPNTTPTIKALAAALDRLVLRLDLEAERKEKLKYARRQKLEEAA